MLLVCVARRISPVAAAAAVDADDAAVAAAAAGGANCRRVSLGRTRRRRGRPRHDGVGTDSVTMRGSLASLTECDGMRTGFGHFSRTFPLANTS